MKLYEIDAAIQKVLDGMTVDEETGEVSLDTEALENLQEARADKLEGAALYVKDLEAMAKAIKAEEEALSSRRKTMEKKAGRIRDWLIYALQGEKLETARVKLSTRKGTQSCVVDDVLAVKDWYFDNVSTANRDMDSMTEEEKAEWERIVKLVDLRYPDPTVSRAGLKKLLADYEIPGVHLEDGKPSLQIK